jgi:hypothetical protein
MGNKGVAMKEAGNYLNAYYGLKHSPLSACLLVEVFALITKELIQEVNF